MMPSQEMRNLRAADLMQDAARERARRIAREGSRRARADRPSFGGMFAAIARPIRRFATSVAPTS